MISVNVIFGKPGSGKTTIGELLEQDPQFIHISTGQIFRDARQKNENIELISMMDELDKTRSLYPDELTANTLEQYIHNILHNKTYDPINQTIILDGFPRNISQYHMMKEKYFIQKAVNLYVPTEVCIDRIINKRNLKDGRPEDENIDILQKSIAEHEKNIDNVYTYLFAKDMLSDCNRTKDVDGNRDIAEVYTDIYNFFRS